MSRTIRTFGLAVVVSSFAASAAMAAQFEDKLLAAVVNNDLAAASLALKNRANPNVLAPDGSSPLAWAVDRSETEMVNLLLKAGAKTGVGSAVPLVLACESGNNAVISLLLGARADVNASAIDGVRAFHVCASRASAENVSRMIEAGASLEAANADGQTALMFAASAGNVENVAVLIKARANVNAASKGGFTPLMFAAKSPNTKVVQALLDAGASNSYAAPDGATALHIALLANNVPVAKILVERGASLTAWDINGRQPLHVAVINGDAELAKLMIAKGAPLNGLTRLAYRVDPDTDRRREGGPRAVVRTASVVGVDISNVSKEAAQRVTDQRGGNGGNGGGRGGQNFRDPLYYDTAAKLGYQPKIVLGALDWAGSVADPAPPTTPLLAAAAAGRADTMKLLVESGADKAFRTDDGNSLMLAAVSSASLDAVKYALTVSPDLKVAKKDGTTVMHIAVTNANRGVEDAKATTAEAQAMMQYLADNGADLTAKNSRGQTPFDATGRAGTEIEEFYSKLLKTHGAPAQADASKSATLTQ
jgi:ankyrin repeat protein